MRELLVRDRLSLLDIYVYVLFSVKVKPLLSTRVLHKEGLIVGIHDGRVPRGQALMLIVQLSVRFTCHLISFRVDSLLEGVPR